ncbi:MAG: flavin reductase family protein [Myxococcales bacterium]|nr:flavin reductase family protein [Myxococcales bacterium]
MRVSLALKKSWRLFNHGPVALVSASAEGVDNVMAAAWVTPLDFDPPKLTVVLAADTYTRALAERSGELVLQVPTVSMLSVIEGVGACSGRDVDKWSKFSIEREREDGVAAPLVKGCVGWLAAKIIAEPRLASEYDLFICQGFAAWADDRVFSDGRLRDDVPPELRAVHHVAGGTYVVDGAIVHASRG